MDVVGAGRVGVLQFGQLRGVLAAQGAFDPAEPLDLLAQFVDDQIVPFEVAGKRSAKLIRGAQLQVYEGAGHGITDTEKERLCRDLLDVVLN